MTVGAQRPNAATAKGDAAARENTKRRPTPFAKVVGGVFALLATVAPDTVSRVVRRMIFSPTRTKPREPGRSILATAKSETWTVGEERVWHYLWGEVGPRVLLVHGWSSAALNMSPFVEPLRQAGYQVLAIDLPAHGRSSGASASVKHFESALANAARRYGPFEGVIAHSLGAAALVYALARGLQSRRAVLLSPVSRFDPVWKNAQRMMNLPEQVMLLVVRRAEAWLGIPFAEMEPVRLAPRLSTPLLVVHDRDDRESPFEDAAALVANWPGARLLATEKLGHVRVLRDPDVVRQVVEFLKASGSPARGKQPEGKPPS